MRVLALTAHLSGVALLFVMIAIELVALCGAPRATTTAQLRAALYAVGASERLAAAATVLILASGVTLVAQSSGFAFTDGWIIVALVLTVVLAVMGSAVQGRHLRILARRAAEAPGDQVTPELTALARDRVWHSSAWAAVGMAFAFLFLMVAKPSLSISLLAFLVGAAVGIATGFIVLARARIPEVGPPSDAIASIPAVPDPESHHAT